MQSVVEMFRIALDTAGCSDVRFITGGVLQRRKSKNPLLEVPKVRYLGYRIIWRVNLRLYRNVIRM